jgi:DNA ligase-4
LESNGSDDGDRHFQLVFFDVLHVDGRGLLGEQYATRRARLREIITVIRGFVGDLTEARRVAQASQTVLVERTPIEMIKGDPCDTLQNILSSSIARFEGTGPFKFI